MKQSRAMQLLKAKERAIKHLAAAREAVVEAKKDFIMLPLEDALYSIDDAIGELLRYPQYYWKNK